MLTIKRITFVPVFTALLIVFTILIPPIPVPIININITLQTFIIMLTGLVLTPIDAFLSVLLYLLIGGLGFPVFSGYTGGIGVLFGPSGGFLLSFPFVASMISALKINKSLGLYVILTGFFGIIITYFIGILWLNYYTSKTLGMILYGMLIFIPFDIVKCILASIIGLRINSLNLYQTNALKWKAHN